MCANPHVCSFIPSKSLWGGVLVTEPWQWAQCRAHPVLAPARLGPWPSPLHHSTPLQLLVCHLVRPQSSSINNCKDSH